VVRFILWVCGLLTVAGTANAADLPLKAQGTPASVPWMEVFGGFAADAAAHYGDMGAVFALNRNINIDGWMLRINGGAGNYRYARTATFDQHVAFQTGEVMLGYQWYLTHGARFSAYLGGYAEHHDNPDPFAEVHGTRGGVKAQVEYYAPLSDRTFVFLMANGVSVWNGYFAIGKLGYRLTNTVSIGPELTALGNDRFGAVRTGPWIGFNVYGTEIFVSGGYSWDTKDNNAFRNNDGAYGTVHLRRVY
jgi:hypothetical protein